MEDERYIRRSETYVTIGSAFGGVITVVWFLGMAFIDHTSDRMHQFEKRFDSRMIQMEKRQEFLEKMVSRMLLDERKTDAASQDSND